MKFNFFNFLNRNPKTFAEKIEATNKAFDAASPEQKRVMIAKDVIERVKTKRLRPVTGNFLRRDQLQAESGSFKDFLNKDILTNGDESETCVVCAKGALFCSIIGRVNKMSVDEVRGMDFSTHSFNDRGHNKLLEYFSPDQVDLIETAFEGGSFLKIADWTDREKSIAFFNKVGVNKYSKSKERLIAICKNIIKNKGTFKP